ncbi:hypothetical protein E4T80_08895, partial [Muribacter muris]
FNQLITFNDKAQHQWHYKYDGLGRRIEKYSERDNTTTKYIWDDGILPDYSFRSITNFLSISYATVFKYEIVNPFLLFSASKSCIWS